MSDRRRRNMNRLYTPRKIARRSNHITKDMRNYLYVERIPKTLIPMGLCYALRIVVR